MTRRNLVATFFFLQGLCAATWAAQIPALQLQLGLSHGQLGTLLLALSVGTLAAMPVVAACMDGRPARWAMPAAALAHAVALAALSGANRPWVLAVALLAFGAANTWVQIAVNQQALAVQVLERRCVMAGFHGCWSVAAATAAVLAYLSRAAGVAFRMHLLGVACLAVGGVAALCLGSELPALPASFSRRRAGARLRPPAPLMALGLVTAGAMATESIAFDWGGVLYRQALGSQAQGAGLGYAFLMVGMTLGRLLANRLTAALRPPQAFAVLAICVTSGILLAASSVQPAAVLGGLGLVGLGLSALVPLLLGTCDTFAEVSPARALAWASAVGSAGALTGPTALGWCAQATGLRPAFAATAALAVVVGLLGRRLLARAEAHAPKQPPVPLRLSPAATRSGLVALIVGGALATAPQPAVAATPATFVAALSAALEPPEVQAGSTVPAEPLISHDNALEALYPATPQVMQAAAALVASATSEVLLQTYEWDAQDEAAQLMLWALKARAIRALAGDEPLLRIRLITSKAWPAENKLQQNDLLDFVAQLRADPRAPGRIEADWATYRGGPLSILHSKTLVVDGERALVMTGNFNTHGGLGRDSVNLAAQLVGPVVLGLQADWHTARALSHCEVATGEVQIFVPTQLHWFAPQGPLTAAILSRQSNWTYWSRGENNPQAQGILALINAADQSIDLLNPALSVPSVQQALLRAISERGVQVRAVLSLQMNRAREHRFFGGDNAEQAYRMLAELLQRGGPALADKLTIAWGSEDGEQASGAHSPGNVHGKAASFDGSCLLLGSTNLNWLSWNNGRELSVALCGFDAGTQAFFARFAELLQTAAPLRASDLPTHHLQANDEVMRYLQNVR